MSARKLIAKNTLIQLVGKVVTASSTILVTMVVTRHFGPAGFGDFTIMITFPTLFWIMADFGFNATMIREISKDQNKSQSCFSNLLLLRFGLAICLTLIALVILYFLPYSPLVKLGAALNLGTIFMMVIFTTSQALFQANLKYFYQVLAQCAGALFNLIFVVGFINLNLPVAAGPWPASFGHAKGVPLQLLWIALGSLLGNILMAGIALLFVARFISLRAVRWDRRVAKALFLATLPIGLALIFDILDVKIDLVMLSILPLPRGQSNNAAVGFYGTALKIFEVTLTAPFFFMSAVYPVLVRHLKENQILAKKTFREALLVLLSGSVLALLVGQVLAPWLIRVLAGPEFASSVPALRILLWALPIFFITSLLMHTLLALEKQRILPWVYGVALAFNFGLNLVFIPRQSFLAAAWITGITETFVLICLAYFVVLGFSRKGLGDRLPRHTNI